MESDRHDLEKPRDRVGLATDATLALYDVHIEVQQSDYDGRNFISRAYEILSRFASDLEASRER